MPVVGRAIVSAGALRGRGLLSVAAWAVRLSADIVTGFVVGFACGFMAMIFVARWVNAEPR